MTHAFNGADWSEREQAEALTGQDLAVHRPRSGFMPTNVHHR
jgi:hypothetical protein